MPTDTTSELHRWFTRAYRSVGSRASPARTNNAPKTVSNRLRQFRLPATPNLFRYPFWQVWSICTPLADLKTRFLPVPVDNPCRSHTLRATPRVVRQPSETVLYRELPTPSRKREGVLVYGPAEIRPGGRGAKCPNKSGANRGSADPAALSVLKPNLGVRRQPPRLLSPHRRQPSQTLAFSG